MSLNLEYVREYCDHPEGLEAVYDAAFKASMELDEEYTFVETGTRSGGSALAIMQAIVDSRKNDRWFFTIDPYGTKPYKEADKLIDRDYDEEHYRRAMMALSRYAYENDVNWVHFKVKSTDWMKNFEKSEFWYDGQIVTDMQYGFAYLDGDHDSDTVTQELSWLQERTPEVQVIVDDAHFLNDNVLKLGTVDQDRLFINTKVGGDEA